LFVKTLNIPKDAQPSSPGVSNGLDYLGLRHEIVDAQVALLSSYLDKRPAEQLIAVLERLIACCRESFREEEALMSRLGGQMDPAHRDRHRTLMSQLEALRFGAQDADRGSLLASLILIDRELIAHLADAARAHGDPPDGDQSGPLPQSSGQH
jgi:hemerythrin